MGKVLSCIWASFIFDAGCYNGLLVRLQRDDHRPWLISIHCVSHRLELSVKATILQQKPFEQVQELMITIYYLMKNSGKFKRHFEETAHALGVQIYKFPKVHGTRFVSHQKKGVRILLHNWIILGQAIENSIANKTHSSLNNKLTAVLNKLRSLKFLEVTCLFYEIVDIVSSLLLQFERGDIVASKVLPAVQQTKERLEDIIKKDDDRSHSLVTENGFTVSVEDIKIQRHLPKEGHMKRLEANREFTQVALDRMVHEAPRRRAAVRGDTDGESVASCITNLKERTVPALKGSLDERFSSLDSELYNAMYWIDPANWRGPEEDVEAMKIVADHFKTTLQDHGFAVGNLATEWKNFLVIHRSFYKGMEAQEMWGKVLQYRRSNFPNICCLVDIVMCIGVSNSSVERGFSILTSMLSDKRISLKHDAMEDLMIIKANHNFWSSMMLVDEVIDEALESFMSDKRRMLLMEPDHPQAKRRKSSDNGDSRDSDHDSNSSSSSDYESEPEFSDYAGTDTIEAEADTNTSAAGSEPESEAESEGESKVDSEPESEAESKADDSEVEPESEADSEPESKADSEQESEADSEPESEADSEPESKADSEQESEADSEQESEADDDREPESESDSEQESEADDDCEPESEADSEQESEADSEPESDKPDKYR